MRKIVITFVVVLLAFFVFLFFSRTDSPTGNVVLDAEEQIQEESQESAEKEIVVKETSILPEKRNYVRDSIELKPYYVLYQNVISNSEGKINVYYKISSDHPVEFLMFPTILDMVSYSERRNSIYNIYQCGSVGKNIEGDCMVGNVGFAIWNTDGGASSKVDY